MNAKEAREILSTCHICKGIAQDICSRGNCLVARTYLAALEGPEVSLLRSESEANKELAIQETNSAVKWHRLFEVERERTKALVETLNKFANDEWMCGAFVCKDAANQALAKFQKNEKQRI